MTEKYLKGILKNNVVKRIVNGLCAFILALIGIYLCVIAVIAISGLIALLIDFIVTGQINPPLHMGFVIACYEGDSNCFSPINSNMFWIVYDTVLMRAVVAVAVIYGLIGLGND